MEIFLDPAMLVGLLTLVVLEVVLGVDNLIFIAILADKLPPKQRDKARIIGLSLALIMRLGLLSVISWIVTLTTPIFSVADYAFSGRDLILIGGGLFLLFKATMELHERLEGSAHHGGGNRAYASFWVVVAQIVVLDAVFSLDAVITAVGMINQLEIMFAAVIIAMGVMLFASKPLTRFVNQHPTIVVLCLSFLLMIGLSLIAEGFGFHIPKGYLYAAMGFSILIETFNQIARRNFVKHEARLPMRERTSMAIMRLLQGKAASRLAQEERYMIRGVLTLADRPIETIMTARKDISWIDVNDPPEKIRKQLMKTPHSLFPVCDQTLDQVLGVMRAKELLDVLNNKPQELAQIARRYAPIYVENTIGVIKLLSILRAARGRIVLVTNRAKDIEGLITPLDILEAIAGEFPDEDETADILREGDNWLVKGETSLLSLMHTLEDLPAFPGEETSIAGVLLDHFGEIPMPGQSMDLGHYRFEVVNASDKKIHRIRIMPLSE